MSRSWDGDGPEFIIPWGGRTWTLKVDDPQPGLRLPAEGIGPLLGLEGLSAKGRTATDVFTFKTLVSWERRADRVEALYTIEGWGGLTVRAVWSLWEGDGIDLEVQVNASSVDELKALEVRLISTLPDDTDGSRPRRWVEPRDARSAGLSYDGRETDVRNLTTLPPSDESNPIPRGGLPGPWKDGWSYAEMVLPHDVARRITEAGKPSSLGHTTRYGLFGHDLEKGVVLRARLRALWSKAKDPRQEALTLDEKFRKEPPPLGP